MLGAKKQKAWLTDQSFARKFGFETVDTAGKYELLALRLDDVPPPRFAPGAKVQTVERRGLTVFYGDQCPYIPKRRDCLPIAALFPRGIQISVAIRRGMW